MDCLGSLVRSPTLPEIYVSGVLSWPWPFSDSASMAGLDRCLSSLAISPPFEGEAPFQFWPWDPWSCGLRRRCKRTLDPTQRFDDGHLYFVENPTDDPVPSKCVLPARQIAWRAGIVVVWDGIGDQAHRGGSVASAQAGAGRWGELTFRERGEPIFGLGRVTPGPPALGEVEPRCHPCIEEAFGQPRADFRSGIDLPDRAGTDPGCPNRAPLVPPGSSSAAVRSRHPRRPRSRWCRWCRSR